MDVPGKISELILTDRQALREGGRAPARAPPTFPSSRQRWKTPPSARWAGHPLDGYATLLNHIRTTTPTATGLKPRAAHPRRGPAAAAARRHAGRVRRPAPPARVRYSAWCGHGCPAGDGMRRASCDSTARRALLRIGTPDDETGGYGEPCSRAASRARRNTLAASALAPSTVAGLSSSGPGL